MWAHSPKLRVYATGPGLAHQEQNAENATLSWRMGDATGEVVTALPARLSGSTYVERAVRAARADST